MWPFKNNKQYPNSFVMEMYRSIVSTWNNESLIRLIENDEDTGKRFFFSSFIQAMIFYAPSEFDALTGKSSKRSIHAVAGLSCVFLNSHEEVTVGDYIRSSLERWDLPAYLSFLGIDSDPSNCLQKKIPLVELISAVYQMRLNRQLAEMKANPEEYVGNLYDYQNPFNPRLIHAGVFLNSVIFDQDILFGAGNMPEKVEQERARSALMVSHSQDLLEAVVTTIKKYP